MLSTNMPSKVVTASEAFRGVWAGRYMAVMPVTTAVCRKMSFNFSRVKEASITERTGIRSKRHWYVTSSVMAHFFSRESVVAASLVAAG